MSKKDIVIKGTKQGIVVSLDSSSDFEELLGRLRIRLKEFQVEDLTGEGQVIVDLGNRDVSQVKLSVLESIFFEYGLVLKRVMSRPDLPKSVAKHTTKSKFSNFEAEKKNKRNQSRTKTEIKEETPAMEATRMNNSVDKCPEFEYSEVISVLPNQEKTEISNLPEITEVAAATLEFDELPDQPLENPDSAKSESSPSVNLRLLTREMGEEAREILKTAVDQPDTILIQKSLRSGQSVQYPGNVVIMGDVNPGAEVIASGNIVVMGSFRGVAHAGALGDENATVTAFRLRPIQLRIAGHITRPPDDENAAPDVPETARIRDGVMIIERY